jgi:hypothetical protein
MSEPAKLADLVALFRGGATPEPGPRPKSAPAFEAGEHVVWRDDHGRWWSRRRVTPHPVAGEPERGDLMALGLDADHGPAAGSLLCVMGDPVSTQRFGDGLAQLAGRRWGIEARVVGASEVPGAISSERGRGRQDWAPPRCDLLVVVGVADWLDGDRVANIAEACIARGRRSVAVCGTLGGGTEPWRRLEGVLRDQGARLKLGGGGKASRAGW